MLSCLYPVTVSCIQIGDQCITLSKSGVNVMCVAFNSLYTVGQCITLSKSGINVMCVAYL